MEEKRAHTVTNKDVFLPSRQHVTNKGDCGKTLIFGGEVGMAGAVSFSSETAYRTGAGLVYIATHPENRSIIQTLLPEAIVYNWENFDFKTLNTYSSVAIGMGMGKSDFATRLLERVISSYKKPLVVDADAINMISQNPELLSLLGDNTVLTPHLGEFSRLIGKSVDEILSSPEKFARDFSRTYNTNLVLKNNVTVISLKDGTTFINTTGNSTLSKGGSGDILSGFIASLLAQGSDIKNALVTATYLFGKAGERAGEKWGMRGALARDIIQSLALTVKDYE
ncbi:MAG: NAD(P)H-hydrate dehydratase [Ruminococcaceae bacterium]|nr:NAD(P)H-hydrate dehydratase [Oscillospiraceae bacterium]